MEHMKLNTLHEVLEDIRKSFGDFEMDAEIVGIEHALDRFVAEDIVAKEDLPGFDRATVDGFAVIAGDTLREHGEENRIFSQIGQSEAGRECKLTLGADECVYVSAGAMIPLNADAVVHIDNCEVIGPQEVAIDGSAERWENIVRKGDDFRKGDVLLHKGMRIGARDIAALAGAGFNSIRVFRKLHASVISTGEEVVEPFNSRLMPGQSRDINSYMISALFKEFGVSAINMGIAKEYGKEIAAAVEKSLSASDIIIITGGSSKGTRDETLSVIKRIEGVEIITSKIGITPGSNTIIAKAGNKIIFGLPGDPASAMVMLNIVVKPFVQLANNSYEGSISVKARCLKKYKSRTNKEEYLIVSIDKDEDQYIAVPLGGRNGYITSILNADGYVKIRPSDDGINEGQEVEVILF